MPQSNTPRLAFLDERPVDAIVGREPSWIVTSGISLVSVIFVLLLLLTWFIRFPDNINSSIVITTSQPPIEMVSKVNGQIMQLYVDNNEKVKYEQPLLLIESTVDYQKLKSLELELSLLKTTLASSSLDIVELGEYQLGELQPTLDKLIDAIKRLKIENQPEQLSMRISHTAVLNEQYQLLQQQLARKKITWEKKLKFEKDILNKKKELQKKGVITSIEILPLENSYLDKLLALDDINIQSNLYTVKLNELSHSLSEFKIQRQKKLKQLRHSVNGYYSVLLSEIANWKQNYLILAPINGQISFSQFWSANQHIEAGDVILTVANKTKNIIGKIQIDHTGVGKIELGQRVDIELNSYPAVEYGRLVGRIKSISQVPGKQGYLVDVSLPTELLTTYGKHLPFSPNLTGSAKVITQEKRLFERFLEKILYVFS